MWDLPRPGLEPVSPALAGGFLTTAPPGKPDFLFFNFIFWPRRAACRSLVPQPGIEPAPGARSLNHRTAREVPHYFLKCGRIYET